MQALQALDARLNEQTHPDFADLEHPINLNIGVIHGGDWPSTVPGACELHCRLSFYPGQTVAETRAKVESAIADAIAGDPWFARASAAHRLGRVPEAGSTVVDGRAVGQAPRRLARAGRSVRRWRLRCCTGSHRQRYYNFVGHPDRLLWAWRRQRARRRRVARSSARWRRRPRCLARSCSIGAASLRSERPNQSGPGLL